MTFSFGSTNFLITPPRGGRKGSVDMDKISVPAEIGSALGFEPDRTYSMKEIMEAVQPMLPPGMEIDEGMIASFLGLGAVVNPMQEDLVFYGKISDDYKKYLKDMGAESDRFDPAPATDGSFELWSYYHLGVPVFSTDLWGVPKLKEEKKESSGITIEALEAMSVDEFVALGEEKIALFLKESGTPEQFTAANLLGMVKSGQVSPKQMAGMMKQMPKPAGDKKKGDPLEQALMAFSDKMLDGEGFVDWKEYDHPTLGKVEIGGFKPFIDLNPPYSIADSLIDINIPWVIKLTEYLPSLAISDTKISDLGGGVYRVEAWVENSGFIPFITAMGMRNKMPSPAIVTLSGTGVEILSGKERTPFSEIGGKSSHKLQWLVKCDKGKSIDVALRSRTAGNDSKQIKL